MKKYIASLAVVLFLLAPLAASAATIAELQVQLNSLLAQVQQVRAEIAAAGGSVGVSASQTSVPSTPSVSSSISAPTCVFSHVLTVGSTDATTGGEVTKLQQLLAADPSTYPEGVVSGYFGPATERAIQHLQTAHSIVSSGTPATTGYGAVGSLTRAALYSLCNKSRTAPTTTPGTNPVNQTTPSGIAPGAVTSPITNPSGNTTTPTPLNVLQAALPSITLDTLPTASTTTTVISGSAANMSSVSVTVRGSDVVFENDTVPVTAGHWSIATSPLGNGSYQVIVRGANGGAVATGFLIVNVPAAANTSSVAASSNETAIPQRFALPVQVTVRVNGSGRGATIIAGASALIGWSTSNATSCGLVSNPVTPLAGPVSNTEAGKSTGPLAQTTTFTLTCVGADGGSSSSAVTVSVPSAM